MDINLQNNTIKTKGMKSKSETRTSLERKNKTEKNGDEP